jgi:hypothetical protein
MVLCLVVSGCGNTPTAPTPAAGSSAAKAAQSDLSGFWVRTDEAGSGNWGAMLAAIAPAELLPAVSAAVAADAAAMQAEQKVLEANASGVYRVPVRCAAPSLVFMMQHSGAFDIVQNDAAILIIPEDPGTQHIYMDRRPHPAMTDWVPDGVGHSVGHWEAGVLVVSTVGMESGGGIPGGGRNARHMMVSFSWNDPMLYTRPHTYAFTYEKQPADSYAFESWCDVTDPLQGQSIVVPSQR